MEYCHDNDECSKHERHDKQSARSFGHGGLVISWLVLENVILVEKYGPNINRCKILKVVVKNFEEIELLREVGGAIFVSGLLDSAYSCSRSVFSFLRSWRGKEVT